MTPAMGYATQYVTVEPSRAEIDAVAGPALIEFGSPGCGWCRAAQPHLASALSGHETVRHLKVVDASRRPLGRSFGITLWPTLVFLENGAEVARLVRPQEAGAIRDALRRIDPQP